jgi:hypothetical protein
MVVALTIIIITLASSMTQALAMTVTERQSFSDTNGQSYLEQIKDGDWITYSIQLSGEDETGKLDASGNVKVTFSSHASDFSCDVTYLNVVSLPPGLTEEDVKDFMTALICGWTGLELTLIMPTEFLPENGEITQDLFGEGRMATKYDTDSGILVSFELTLTTPKSSMKIGISDTNIEFLKKYTGAGGLGILSGGSLLMILGVIIAAAVAITIILFLKMRKSKAAVSPIQPYPPPQPPPPPPP